MTRHPEWARELATLISRWLRQPTLDATQRSLLRGVVGSLSADISIQDVVGEALRDKSVGDTTRVLLLDAAAGASIELPASWQAGITAALNNKNQAIVHAALVAIGASKEGEFKDVLLQLARNGSRDVGIRTRATALLAKRDKEMPADLFDLLVVQAGIRKHSSLRLTAARALGSARLSHEQQLAVTRLIESAGPLELPVLLGAFDRGGSIDVGRSMLQALKKSPGITNVPSEQLVRLLSNYPATIRSEAEELVKRAERQSAATFERIERLRGQLVDGDPGRGRALFFGGGASCSACHQVAGEGGRIGPDLTHIGDIRKQPDLLESIVAPSATFVRGFEPVNVVTNAGKVYGGVIERETDQQIFLRMADRTLLSIRIKDIDELVSSTVSIMPQGLDRILSTQELSDLLAYLQSLKSSP